jgi:two-component system OmpR family response regulator
VGSLRVLVVEDHARMADVVRRGLVEAGMSVDVAVNGTDAIWRAGESDYDAVVLDLGLPDIDGLDVLRQLRNTQNWAPVLVLTARDGLADRVAGLDLGADDYLVKPFALEELLARLRALRRRAPAERPAVVAVGALSLDPASHEVRRSGTPIALSPKEFALLEVFVRHPGEVLSKTYLVEHCWDDACELDSNVVEVYVGYLRRKIDDPFGVRSLVTVRGAGYRLDPV